MVRALLTAAFLVINLTCAEAIDDMNVCYILDGILIFYGIVLTVLYYRLRMSPCQRAAVKKPEKKPVEGGIYAVRLFMMLKKTFQKAHDGKGLSCQSSDVYETIRMDKKPIV
ncbi:Fc receptor, IgE, high affinity I, gamma polypeptide like isoform X1 [Labrus mixtus]|uniref:Fc receptor, IgE, high affinity I, gamma polypeptide like isoform X1 n=1 Tax=Labrus mixtus TaxID=508554 RepID=UPI0029C0D424|nr:Fc receptor, IgE, high affinity I, gamma polypeptide like isoform X1 [Labrus mixtus]